MHLDSLYHGIIPEVAPGKLCVIGDVHNRHGGFMEKVRQFLDGHTDGQVVQLGDFCGSRESWQYFMQHMIKKEEMRKIRILLGNHDSGVPLRHDLSLQDYAESKDGDIIAIRGAETPAFARLAGRSYYGEELSDGQFADILTIIKNRGRRPRVVITHDGPLSVVKKMWPDRTKDPSRTTTKLQEILAAINLLDLHPAGTTWIFGHHHENQEEMNGVNFRAIGELETLIV